MERKIYDSLLAWKVKSNRKPLILEGARQVGKTWLMQEFGKREYNSYVYVNFDREVWAKNLFEHDYDINRILLRLQAQTNVRIVAGETLIIFDELQEAARGLGVLKYFQEEAPEQHVIVAGSLLGITLHQGQSFPVGKVDILRVQPLTFVEFLYALGEDAKARSIEQHDWDVLQSLSYSYEELLRQYYFVGGMPEAVAKFAANHDLEEVRAIQQNILSGYRHDISKHAPTREVQRILQVLHSLPSQLSRENKKFLYGVLRNGARAKEYELAIQWLIDAGVVIKVPRTSEAIMPLSFYEDLSAFKLFLLDNGLLGCLARVPASQVLGGEHVFREWKGAFTEQFVLQQLLFKRLPIYYWSNNNSECEIDFLLQTETRIIPIEVKAEENVHSKSLRYFIQNLYPSLKGLRISLRPYIDQVWMENIPLYAAGEADVLTSVAVAKM
ncbi:MAG: ATP-binding protein [Bacteroides sp.]|nr:ATP-binding protein [Bacteroides sp.]